MKEEALRFWKSIDSLFTPVIQRTIEPMGRETKSKISPLLVGGTKGRDPIGFVLPHLHPFPSLH